MVRSKNLASYDVVANVVVDCSSRYEKIVETPANIFGPRIPHVGPESIGFFFVRIKVSEGVDKSSLK